MNMIEKAWMREGHGKLSEQEPSAGRGMSVCAKSVITLCSMTKWGTYSWNKLIFSLSIVVSCLSFL